MSQALDLNRFILLPELKLLARWHPLKFRTYYKCEKVSDFEVCPKCATKSYSVHDRRWVKIKDSPVRGVGVYLQILKRRFRCPNCKKVFTEPVPGIQKGYRTTQRYRRGVKWACENFADLKRVQKAYACSAWLVYKIFYEQLELKSRERLNDPWPKTIGIDEHSFRRQRGRKEFVTNITDYNNKRFKEIVLGKTRAELERALAYIPGRENVRNVIVDLCDPFKSFAKNFFPNACIIADKFHVLKLLAPALNKRRKEITGDKRKHPARWMLLTSGKRLDYFERRALQLWLNEHPVLNELYHFKEALHGFYRINGYERAKRAFTKMTDRMALSQLPEIKSLRRTLMRWRKEILAYFKTKLTNGKTEGYNNLAKLLQRRAFGFRSFENYRLRLLNM